MVYQMTKTFASKTPWLNLQLLHYRAHKLVVHVAIAILHIHTCVAVSLYDIMILSLSLSPLAPSTPWKVSTHVTCTPSVSLPCQYLDEKHGTVQPASDWLCWLLCTRTNLPKRSERRCGNFFYRQCVHWFDECQYLAKNTGSLPCQFGQTGTRNCAVSCSLLAFLNATVNLLWQEMFAVFCL